MTPKELQVVYDTIEHIMQEAYRRGQEDQAAGKAVEPDRFRLSKASKLTIKTNIEKSAKIR
jgi:hypothetical protein